jgi:hypothetical protein
MPTGSDVLLPLQRDLNTPLAHFVPMVIKEFHGRSEGAVAGSIATIVGVRPVEI